MVNTKLIAFRCSPELVARLDRAFGGADGPTRSKKIIRVLERALNNQKPKKRKAAK